MTPETTLGLALSLPALGALLVGAAGSRPNLRETVTLVATLSTFAATVALLPEVMSGGRPQLELLEVFPGVALAFEAEPLGMLFALVASGLWIVTSLYSIGYLRGNHEERQTRFFVCFAIAISATLGVAFARNLFTLFLFYELLTLSTYPLVTHRETREAMQGGRTYLGILLTTSVAFLLLAIIWTWQLSGTLEFRPGGILAGHVEGGMAAALLALYAFGIGKAALMPFHRWLPAAMVAPTPVSALLHAVAVVKAGVFAVLKVVVYVFGVDFLQVSGVSSWLTYVAAITILAASVIALTKDNLKARLAYSTVSQLAHIVLGAALATSSSVVGGGLHMATHAMGKITLFFCAGAIDVATRKKSVSELDGIGRSMPFTMGAFLLGSLSIIGLPPFGGAWSKWYLVLGAAEGERFLFIGVLMLSSLLSIGYLMPIVARAFFAPPQAGSSAPPAGIREAPLLCLVPLCLTALGSLALFFAAPRIYALLITMLEG
ncbi:MAG: monovalent cation/H+ antiporter subunit D family protein [Myxococcota bacterium]